MYDVIVIGGGPSGLMAAISAAEKGARKVLLLEKGHKLGQKLAISGGGRCNVTNRMPIEDLVRHIPGNGRFLYSALSEFNNEDIIWFFEDLGIPLKEEDHGRMFPVSNKAQSVVDVLVDRLKELNIEIRTNTPVKTIHYVDGKVKSVETTEEKFLTNAVVVAVGGKSVPQTGSTGDGYAWAEKAGHKITELYPTEVPITSNERFIKEKILQGLSLRDIELSVLNEKGKTIIRHRLDMIFTHFGISGPAALRSSQFVVKELKKSKANKVTVAIDLFPDKNIDIVLQELTKRLQADSKKAIKNALKGYLPERYLHFLLDEVDITSDMIFAHLSKEKLRQFAEKIKQFTFTVNGTLSIEQAFVTGGGVSIKEVDPKTMASKLMKGLYFCGEILDLHGYTGGYNITVAFVTGHVAGQNAARKF